MRNFRSYLFLGLLMLAALLSGCGDDPQTGISATSKTPVTLPVDLPEEAEPIVEEKLALSCEMAVFGKTIIFVDKTDMLIKVLNTETEEIGVVFDFPIYGEFILDGTQIVFTDADSGKLILGDVLKGSYSELGYMSMGKGAKLGDMLFFVDTRNYGNDYGLYRYDLSTGLWENRRLIANPCSPSRETVVFGEEAVWYTSYDGEYGCVCSMSYEDLESETVFVSEHEKGIVSLFLSNGDIFFADADKVVYRVKRGNGVAEVYLEGATKIHSVSSEGVFYQRSSGYPAKLYLGNDKGNILDVHGGVVVASYGSRSIIRRFSDGKEILVVVKYPDDSVIYSRECSLFDTVSNGRYVMAFISESSYLYFFDLETGGVQYYENDRLMHKGVSAEEYWSDESGLKTPSHKALYACSDAEVANLFMEAVRRDDRYTLRSLICEDDSLTPFSHFGFESWELNELWRTETSVKYSVKLNYYSELDESLKSFLPDCLKNGGIVLVKENDLWKVDTNAS